jgi:hypothetical protein
MASELNLVKELAIIYICKAFERLALAEFKTIHIINAYAALPATHLIRSLPASKHIAAMCCTPKYIYYTIDGFGDIYIISYVTNKLIANIEFFDDFKQYDNLKLLYCNGIVHFSYDEANYTIYKLIDAETHTIINTFKITDILYTKYITDAPLIDAVSALKTRYVHCDYVEHADYICEIDFDVDGCVSKIYHFKHSIRTFSTYDNILIIYSDNLCYMYYIDMLLDDSINTSVMSWPRKNRILFRTILQLANVLYVIERNQIIIIDLTKKTINTIDHNKSYTAGCFTPNGNLLLASNKSSAIDEYF